MPVEKAAVDELLTMLQLRETVERDGGASPESFDGDPAIERVAVTPDFHKAAGIPVGTVLATRGFVVPQAIGNDINCGMRLHVTYLAAEGGCGEARRVGDGLPADLLRGGPEHPHDARPARGDAPQRPARPARRGADEQTEGLWALFHEADLERELTGWSSAAACRPTASSD